MRYIKLFESFNTRKILIEIKSDCDDILLELKDLGFKTRVDIHRNNITSKSWIKISISKEVKIDVVRIGTTVFEIEEVIEYINRLDDYLSSVGFKIDGYDKPDNDRYFIRTEVVRNPANYQVVALRSFIELYYQVF
jgi:hypothetical protein